MQLLDGSLTTILYELTSRGKPAVVGSPDIRLPAGTYFIKVIPYQHTSVDYHLTVHSTAEGIGFEKEFNDSARTATAIVTGQEITGNLYTDSDRDYYKFELPASGRIVIDFWHALIDSTQRYWDVELLDESLTRFLYGFTSRGKPAEFGSSVIRLPAGTYYLRVTPYYHSSIDYHFLIRYAAEGTGFEEEFNDSARRATQIIPGRQVVGNLYRDSDVDYYQFNLPSSGEVRFRFGHEMLNSTSRFWDIFILDGSLTQVLYEFTSRGQQIEVVTPSLHLSAGDYYAKIAPYHHSEVDYVFEVEF